LFVKRIEQMVGDPDGPKSCHQYRRSVANSGYGIGGGLDLLVDHVKGLLWAALSFGVRGLCRINRPGIEHRLRRRESHKFAAVIRIEPLRVVPANAG
jgi:hypothetical protein